MTVRIMISLAGVPPENREAFVAEMLSRYEGSHWKLIDPAVSENKWMVTYERIEDAVNHPPHYTKYDIECIDVSENLNFNLGNALKYVWRHRDKGNPEIDLEKAEWYLRREVLRRNSFSTYKPSLLEAVNQFEDAGIREILTRILVSAVSGRDCSDLSKAVQLIRTKRGVLPEK